jgi:mannosylglycerate hydrolase
MARRVTIVPHTHWDREWYEPLAAFRVRLVETLDLLLDVLERDPTYRCFMLDGQMAMVDDYLQVRPEAAERIRRLAVEGRLAVGPWYVLPDEFLVTGETLVRNLQLGLARAAAFGGAMAVGYLPDMFGHIGQMPQLLRQAGMDHAVVWRGVPAAIERTAFWWEAPDGSTVRAEYLPDGYGNGAALPADADDLLRFIDERIDALGSFLVGDLLLMHGTDHQPPRPWLGPVVVEADRRRPDLGIGIRTLAEHLADAPTDGLPRWRGELRSGSRANVLMGVASNRIDVKQAAARCHRALERRCEPYDALFGDPRRDHGALLELAWLQAVRNAAHDSICACSVDTVVDEVLTRYADAQATADALARRALEDLAGSCAVAGPVVVNATARPRRGVVVVELPVDDTPAAGRPADGPGPAPDRPEWSGALQVLGSAAPGGGAVDGRALDGPAPDQPAPDEGLADAGLVDLQVADGQVADGGLADHRTLHGQAGGRSAAATPGDGASTSLGPTPGRAAIPDDLSVDRSTAETMVALLPATSRIDDNTWVHDVGVEDDESELVATVVLGDRPRPGLDPIAVRDRVVAALHASRATSVRVRFRRVGRQRVLALVGPVPSFGWAVLAPSAPAHPAHLVDATGPDRPVHLGNGLVSVEVDPATGTFALDGISGFGRLVDGGDVGDSYNYSPPAHDRVVDRAHQVTVTPLETGPIRSRVRITLHFRWPQRADTRTGRRLGDRDVVVQTDLAVHADEPFVRVRMSFVNPCEDHRVRVHLPLPEPAATSIAECAFGVAERGLEAEGRPEELGLPTFPSQRFVQAGGLTVVHDGLPEYELVDIVDVGGERRATALALTVLRATGMLSRVGMTNRPVPAGPLLAVPGLQLVGRRIVARYAIARGTVDPYAMADDVLLPLEVVTAPGGGWRPPSGSALRVEGGVVSAVRRHHGGLELRVHNPTPRPVDVHVPGTAGAVVDLAGRPLGLFDGTTRLDPFAIASLHLTGPPDPSSLGGGAPPPPAP